MNGFFKGPTGGGRFLDWFKGDEGAARMSGIGMVLSQLDQGQPINVSPALNALQERKSQNELKKTLGSGEYMDKFSAQERAFLATLPPQAAQELIAQRIFARPEATKGVAVGGNLVDPITGRVIYQSPQEEPETYRTLSGEEAAAMGLDPSKAYNIGPDNKITQIGGNGTSITLNTGPTGVDYGEPGPGLVWQRDAEGNVMADERGAPIAIPYQGGPAWRTQQEQEAEAATKAAKAADQAGLSSRAAKVVLEDIGRFRETVAGAKWYNPATGFGAQALSEVGGTSAADAAALSQTIRSNIGFDRLDQMRQASPTGGALGQVAVQELQALQASLGSLEQSQNKKQLLENIDRLEKIYMEIMRKAAAYDNAAEFGFADGGTQDADPLGLR